MLLITSGNLRIDRTVCTVKKLSLALQRLGVMFQMPRELSSLTEVQCTLNQSSIIYDMDSSY